RPNVLFIVMDDLRATLGSYGDTTTITPNIERLAARSLLFIHAYVQQAVCNPSRQSFLSGRRPDAIRVWNLMSHFRQTAPDLVSLPEHFKHYGYITEGIGKIYHDLAYADRVAALSGELKKGFMTFLTFMPLRAQNPLPDLPQPSSGQM